jgi:putative addiction module component (TIGR02574 family)
MDESPQNILDLALRLPDSDRAAIAASLINSLDADSDLDVEEHWDAEIKRRVEEIDNGTVELIPLSAVREKLAQIRNG